MNNKLQYHLIPTEDASLIFMDDTGKIFHSINIDQEQKHFKPQHLYLTSDAPIKEGDWFYSEKDKYISILEGCRPLKEWQKIECTTDPKLIADGVPAIDGETKAKYYERDGESASNELVEVNFLEEFCKRWNEKGKIVCWNCGAEKKVLTGLCSSCGRFHINQKDNKKVEKGVWIKCSERLPKEEAGTIYAVRMWADRESRDVNAYCEMCLLENGNIRIDDDEIPRHYAILENYDWLDEAPQSQAGGFSLEDMRKAKDYGNGIGIYKDMAWDAFIQSLTKEAPKGDIVIECEMELCGWSTYVGGNIIDGSEKYRIKLTNGQPTLIFK